MIIRASLSKKIKLVAILFIIIQISGCGSSENNSTTQVSVPDVTNVPQSTATNTIVNANLTVGNISNAAHDTITQGNVVSQSHQSGSYVDTGTTIDIVISSGPDNSNNPSTIQSVYPADGDNNIIPNIAEITVDFKTEIDPSTANENTFTLSNGINGTITVSNTNKRVIFSPTEPLQRGLVYTVTINGILDNNANPVIANNQAYSWTFSTCEISTTSSYTISWDRPNDSDLAGYRIYYGKSIPLTKNNSIKQDIGDNTTWVFNPSSLGFLPCDTVAIAVSSLGNTKSESGLSLSQLINID